MNDKAIRNILIAYLKASNHEIRIYQEKSIQQRHQYGYGYQHVPSKQS